MSLEEARRRHEAHKLPCEEKGCKHKSAGYATRYDMELCDVHRRLKLNEETYKDTSLEFNQETGRVIKKPKQ